MKTGFSLLLFLPLLASSQYSFDSVRNEAGKEYHVNAFQNLLKGSNYRKEWTKPVLLPVFSLNHATVIKPVLNEEKRKVLLIEIANKTYILKTPDRQFPIVSNVDIKGTILQKIVDDKVSAFYPYGESIVSELAEGARLFNTDAKYVFIRTGDLPDSLKNDFGNRTYAAESLRQQGNISEFTSTYVDTDSLIRLAIKGTKQEIDEKTYLRSRLFDIYINDWKTEDAEIKWLKKNSGNKQILTPIAINRDRAFFYYNGPIFQILLGVAQLKYIQPFQSQIDEKKTFQIATENNDRFFTTSLTAAEWNGIAASLQRNLTDDIIGKSVKTLPPEVYAISGKELTRKLVSRRNNILDMAKSYYRYLNEEVDIPGSEMNEVFKIRQPNDSVTEVTVSTGKKLLYQRRFLASETKEIRLYGISGENHFNIQTNKRNKTELKVIGGIGMDSIIHSGNGKIEVFDNPGNYLQLQRSDKKIISSDTAINRFTYRQYAYKTKAFIPSAFYSNEDQIYISAGYEFRTFKWRRTPFASKHRAELHYSLMDKGFSVTYNGRINKIAGKWNLDLFGNYDQIRWTPFFGLGNDTKFEDVPTEFYRMRTREWNASATLKRRIGLQQISLGPVFKSLKIIDDKDRFLSKELAEADPSLYTRKTSIGWNFGYELKLVNDSIVPTEGVTLQASASFNKNFSLKDGNFQKYGLSINGILPLTDKVSFSTTIGAITVSGNPYFFQYPYIGGPTLRGFMRNRFWGKTVFHNNNDIRYITDFRSFLFNGKAGTLVFVDAGRVWMPEMRESNKWHPGFGLGIIAVPFNKIYMDGTLGYSKDGLVAQFRTIQYF